MMMQSIAAFIFRRNDYRDHFTLNSAQRAFTIHQLSIEIIVLAHGSAMNTVNPQYVVLIRDPVVRRNRFFGYVIDECHIRLLYFMFDRAPVHIAP